MRAAVARFTQRIAGSVKSTYFLARRDILARSKVGRAFFIGYFLCAVGFLGGMVQAPYLRSAAFGSLLLGSFFIAGGFALWAAPKVKDAWETDIGKVLITLPHALIVLVSATFSRFYVSAATGLPPQDFDLACTVVTTLLCVPVWAMTISVLMTVGAFVLIGIQLFVHATLTWVLPIFGRKFDDKAAEDRIQLGFGAVAFGVFMLLPAALIFSNKNITRQVQWVVFQTEYHHPHMYPGIKANERIHVHENGVVSVATMTDAGIAVTLRKFDDSKLQ